MIINRIPQYIKKALEITGLEDDNLSHRDDNLYVDCDDFELACQLRTLIKREEAHSCRLVTNPISRMPTLEIEGAIQHEP